MTVSLMARFNVIHFIGHGRAKSGIQVSTIYSFHSQLYSSLQLKARCAT